MKLNINDGKGSGKTLTQNIIATMARMFKPPSRETVTSIVGRTLKLPEGGSFDISIVPYIETPLNYMDDRGTHMIVYVSPARAGKTLGLVVGSLAYIIENDPADTLIVHITETTARKFSKLTISRALENSPALRQWMPSTANNNVLSKLFKNGMALQIGYPAPAQLAGSDFKYVLASDTDRWVQDNGEGDPLKQADKRTQTFGTGGKMVIESSPKFDITDPDWERSSPHEAPPTEGILSWYNMGSRHIEYWQCLHCSDFFPLHAGLELFNLPDRDTLVLEVSTNGKEATVKKYDAIFCPKCGCKHTPSDREKLVKSSKWLPENDEGERNPIKSFWGSGYSAGFQTWASIISEYINALMYFSTTGDESKLRATANLDQGRSYMPIAMDRRVTANELEKRAYNFGNRTIPEGVLFLIANIDTQQYSFVVDIEGVGLNGERWIIDRYDISLSDRSPLKGETSIPLIQPAVYPEDWELIVKHVLNRRYPLGDGSGREMGIIHAVCDMHGMAGVTENAYRFLRRCNLDPVTANHFSLLRGESPKPELRQAFVVPTVITKTSKSAIRANVAGKIKVYRVNTTTGKDIVMNSLFRPDKGINYIHFSKFLPQKVFTECVVEVRTAKGWENRQSKRNEQFDLLNYGLANIKILTEFTSLQKLNWESLPEWAKDWDHNSYVFESEESITDRQSRMNAEADARMLDLRGKTR